MRVGFFVAMGTFEKNVTVATAWNWMIWMFQLNSVAVDLHWESGF